MFGRLFRIVLGLAIVVAAADIWRPSIFPHGVVLGFGEFEDLRSAAVLTLSGVGAAFVIAGLVGSGQRRSSRATPISAFALPPAEDFEPRPPSQITLTRPTPPASLVPAPKPSPTRAVLEASSPRVEPAPLEETATAAWIPAPTPAFANSPIAEPEPPAAIAPSPSCEPDREAFVAATESGHRLRLDGKLDEAMERFSHALRLARANLRAAPKDVQAHADLAGALTNVGDIHLMLGRQGAALAAHEEGLLFHRALAAHSPQDRAALRGLWLGLARLADTCEASGNRDCALGLYRASVPIAERLAAEHAGDALLENGLAKTRERLTSLETQALRHPDQGQRED